MDIAEAIRMKRAVRRYSPQPIPDDSLRAILNAGRRAQSAKNQQPWHFIAVQDRGILQAISRLGTYAGILADAAAAVAILTPDPALRWSILFDAGQAAAYMQLAAWGLGIGSCPVSIYEPEKARSVLGFPSELHIRAALALGYPADPREMDRPPEVGGRKPLHETVSYDRWAAA